MFIMHNKQNIFISYYIFKIIFESIEFLNEFDRIFEKEFSLFSKLKLNLYQKLIKTIITKKLCYK